MKRSYSQYARIFDASSTRFGKDQEYNYILLPGIQAHLNVVLKCKGYLFLNEAYKFMGFPEIREGQLVGWIYNNTRKDSVDFRIPKKMPKNGNSILVDFNATPILEEKEIEDKRAVAEYCDNDVLATEAAFNALFTI